MIRAIQRLPGPLAIIIIYDDDGMKRNKRWEMTYIEIEIEQCKCMKQCFHSIKRKMVYVRLWNNVKSLAEEEWKEGKWKYVKIRARNVVFIGIHSVVHNIFIAILDTRYTLLGANKTWLIFSFNAKKKNKIYFYYSVNDERVVDSMFHGLPMKKFGEKNIKRNLNACALVIQVNSRIICAQKSFENRFKK